MSRFILNFREMVIKYGAHLYRKLIWLFYACTKKKTQTKKDKDTEDNELPTKIKRLVPISINRCDNLCVWEEEEDWVDIALGN
jgi:hypothetical protein